MSDPIVIILTLCAPLGVVIIWLLWHDATGLPEDHWYALPQTRRRPVPPPIRNPEKPVEMPVSKNIEDVTPELLEVCERALFCWDFWSTGKSGVNLQDLFEVRDLPARLRATIAKAKDDA